jgi:hypothetical protein
MKTTTLIVSVMVMTIMVTCSSMVVSAENGLLFGGVFQISDPYCDYCTSPNLLSNSGFECGCPAGYTTWPAAPSSHGPYVIHAMPCDSFFSSSLLAE